MKNVVWVAVLWAGCGYRVEKNDNDGAEQQLTLYGARAQPYAALEPLTVTVVRQDVGTYDCVDHGGTSSFGSLAGSGPWTECSYAGTPAPIGDLSAARCPAGDCAARVVDASHVELTPSGAGDIVLEVAARLADGREVTDRWTIAFVAVEEAGLECQEWAECPGPNAIFTGAELPLVAWAAAGGNLLDTHVAYAVEPAGVAELVAGKKPYVSSHATYLRLRALAAGVALVRVSSGGVESVHRFRIVDPSEAVRGRAWRIAKGTTLRDTTANVLGEPLGDVLEVKHFHNVHGGLEELVAGWELRDGTVAIGGASTLGSTVSRFVKPAHHDDDDDPALARFFVDSWVVSSGTHVSLTGHAGPAVMEQTFEVKIVDVP